MPSYSKLTHVTRGELPKEWSLHKTRFNPLATGIMVQEFGIKNQNASVLIRYDYNAETINVWTEHKDDKDNIGFVLESEPRELLIALITKAYEQLMISILLEG